MEGEVVATKVAFPVEVEVDGEEVMTVEEGGRGTYESAMIHYYSREKKTFQALMLEAAWKAQSIYNYTCCIYTQPLVIVYLI